MQPSKAQFVSSCERWGHFLIQHFTLPSTAVAASSSSSSSLVVAAGRAAALLVPSMAELSLSRMDTSRRGAQVLFGGGKPAAAGAAASLFIRAVGQDDPAGAAVGAAAGGTGVRTMVLVVSPSPRTMKKLKVANKEDLCKVGICVGRSGAPYAEMQSSPHQFLRIITVNDRR